MKTFWHHDAGYLHDPHAERRDRAARERIARELIRARRWERWADRTARVSAALARRAVALRARAS